MKKLKCPYCYVLLVRIRNAKTPENAQLWREIRVIHRKKYHVYTEILSLAS